MGTKTRSDRYEKQNALQWNPNFTAVHFQFDAYLKNRLDNQLFNRLPSGDALLVVFVRKKRREKPYNRAISSGGSPVQD